MLIWKVIAANPGITRAGIWERVEHSIPEGYALRMYAVEQRKKAIPSADASSDGIARARSYVLTFRLHHMRHDGTVVWEGKGRDRRYTVAREIKNYSGNPAAIDETGTKAAEHMAVAHALRCAEKALSKPYSKGAGAIRSRGLYDALTVMVKALRAKQPDY